MQSATGGGSSSSSSAGTSELSRCGGLSRFRSAPATWLEALLEEADEDPLKPNQCLTQLLAGNSATPSSRNPVSFGSSAEPGLLEAGSETGFLRQNSSPAEFLGNSGIGSDEFLSNFGISGNYGFSVTNMEVSPAYKRPREPSAQQHFSPRFFAQLKVEPGNQVTSGVSSLIDLEMEKLLEDSVPCRLRAKRGCATHPRSIAERVRRTRISDRIRKLQDLVPNMDKQTNTADMLEEAVEYVKFLQRQIQELTEHQRRCKCTVKE